MLEYLRVAVAASVALLSVSRLLWYDAGAGAGRPPRWRSPPSGILDTSGAGDVFHGVHLSYLTDPSEHGRAFQLRGPPPHYRSAPGNGLGATLADIDASGASSMTRIESVLDPYALRSIASQNVAGMQMMCDGIRLEIPLGTPLAFERARNPSAPGTSASAGHPPANVNAARAPTSGHIPASVPASHRTFEAALRSAAAVSAVW